MTGRKYLALGVVVIAISASAVRAEEVVANDLLMAALWTQRSVEFKGNALGIYALGKVRLDQALAELAIILHTYIKLDIASGSKGGRRVGIRFRTKRRKRNSP